MSLLHQSSRHRYVVVPHTPEGHPPPGLYPVQVARHQDCGGAVGAGHASAVPLQHAWLHGEEDAGRLRRRQGVVEKMRKDGKEEVEWSEGNVTIALLSVLNMKT